MCGGGGQQKNAANQESALSGEMANIFRQNENVVGPFAQERLKSGLRLTPELSVQQNAQAFAPARAQLAQRLARMRNTGLPSGFETQANTDLDAAQARSAQNSILQNFLLNDQARTGAAQMLNPLAFGSQAQQGYGQIMQMPQQPSMFGSILGGALGGMAGGI